jgi:hypothetical protein
MSFRRDLAPSPWKGEGWGGVKISASTQKNFCMSPLELIANLGIEIIITKIIFAHDRLISQINR